jgi:hypothetical protein
MAVLLLERRSNGNAGQLNAGWMAPVAGVGIVGVVMRRVGVISGAIT